jgi:hypothetical protein
MLSLQRCAAVLQVKRRRSLYETGVPAHPGESRSRRRRRAQCWRRETIVPASASTHAQHMTPAQIATHAQHMTPAQIAEAQKLARFQSTAPRGKNAMRKSSSLERSAENTDER